MHKFLELDLDPTRPQLTGQEGHHAIRVLRLRAGSIVGITDGHGTRITGEIEPQPNGTCQLVHYKVEIIPQPIPIHMGIGILHDADRMEWMVEKMTELGVTSVAFLETERSERNRIRKDRLEKIASSALKQSGGTWLPQITGPEKTLDWLQRMPAGNRFVGYMPASQSPHLIRQAQPGLSSAVLIGPEGDLTDSEFKNAQQSGFKPVNLGPFTLRSETAAITACLTLRLVNLPA